MILFGPTLKRSCLTGRIFFTTLLLIALANGTCLAAVKLEPRSWQTGILEEGSSVKLELKISNSGTKPLLLRRIFHSCDCLKVTYKSATLPPQGFATAVLELTAFELDEKFEEFLYVETDDPATPIIRYSITGGMKFGGRRKVYPAIHPGENGRALLVHFFFSPTCAGCDELRTGVFARVMADFGDRVAIIEHDVSDTSDNFFNYRLLRAYEEKHGIRESEPAEAFVGDRYILGKESVSKTLYDVVGIVLLGDPAPMRQAFGGGTWEASVAGAVVFGLLDGLNPCVFAGLIFFLSYLLISGLSGLMLFGVGLVYSLGVFITYVCMGLALFGFFYSAEAFPGISSAFSVLSAVLALVVGLVSFRDAWYAGHGRLNEIWLRLPKRLQGQMHEIVRNRRKRFALLGSTFLLGCIVTLIEGACTGLQYIPATRMMILVGEDTGTQLYGLLLLLLYNAAFMVPLLVIFALVLVGSKRLTATGKMQAKSAAIVRLLTGICLIFLGVALLIWS